MGKTGKGKKKKSVASLYLSLVRHIKRNHKAYIVYVIIQTAVVFTLIRSILEARWENVATCVFAQILLLLPPLLEKGVKINLPTTMEVVAYVFVFAAEILGEVGNYYEKVPYWDTALHTLSGFMFAAFGFCLVDIFNRNDRFSFKLAPGYLAFMAFCFSMTIGVCWELFEHTADSYLGVDMQKDTVVTSFQSVYLDENKSNYPVPVKDIKHTEIVCEDGDTVEIEGGYLDIGIHDTIDDLFVNLIGAVTFSLSGYFFMKFGGNSRFVESLVPVPVDEADAQDASAGEENSEDSASAGE